MRSFGIAVATAFVAATADASILDTIIGTVNQYLDTDITQHPAWDFHVTTRADTHKTIKANKRSVKPLTHAQRVRYVEAHHSLMAQRERLGLARVGSGPTVGQDYAELNSWSGFVLNLLSGMTYTKGAQSKCYDAAESFIISADTGTDVLKKMYIPAYWAELQVQGQDFIAISSGLYVDCNIDKMFNTITHLVSTEGVSELSGRVGGAWLFEISQCREAYSDPESFTTKERGYRYGKCVSILLNYTI